MAGADGGMRWHADRDNVVLFAILLKHRRYMALVAVEDKHPVFAFSPLFCMLVKVLNPF